MSSTHLQPKTSNTSHPRLKPPKPSKPKPKPPNIEEEDDDNKENMPPLYCYCNGTWTEVMVRCDNKLCSKQFFHFEHTKLTKVPGRWLCDYCEMKPLSKLRRYREGE